MDLDKNESVVAVLPAKDKWAVFVDETGPYARKVDIHVVVKVERPKGGVTGPSSFLHSHHCCISDEDGCVWEPDAKAVVTARTPEEAVAAFNTENAPLKED